MAHCHWKLVDLKMKKPSHCPAFSISLIRYLSLTSLKSGLSFVYYIDTPFSAHDPAVTVAALQRAE